jgi:hypothetical protein
MIKYEVSKISQSPNPKCPTPSPEEYDEARDWFDKYKSLPKDYTVEGVFIYPLEVGSAFLLSRSKRNGIEVRGVMQSSAIVKLEKDEQGIYLIETNNSIYTAKPIAYTKTQQ